MMPFRETRAQRVILGCTPAAEFKSNEAFAGNRDQKLAE
jgi:hypothetical protein